MNCPNCGTANEAGRKFCGECGTALNPPCAACGSPNAPGTKFCGECGTPLTTGAAPAQATGPTAERRLVSVLFADLVGFTSLSETRDAEQVRDLLSRYFETARQVIGAYGGTVEKFIGDAVMAVWGAPVAFEDDAERAVRSALDLVAAVGAMGREVGGDLQLRAGVLTGEAAVTLGATNQGMVAGDLVNTASRLQSVAPPGSVLVGEGTMHAAAEAIAFEPAGEQLLKGKLAPVPAWRALRVVAQRGGVGRSEQLEAPFVGRGPELQMLKDFHVATGAERRPRLVSIIGQGGIGKSRLVWEFLKYIDGVTEVVYWHQGRSPAYGEGISFWALAEMVRSRAKIADGDDPSTARAKLSGALDEWVTDDAERRWMEPRLLQLLGLEVADADERPDREALFTAWRVFFERIAEKGVVILVFEDLQWADDGLLDFIDHILEWTRDRPVYVIGLARPELLDRRPSWGAGRRNFTSLVLEPLTADEMRELLAGLVPGLPDPVVDRVLERAEGIPLYAVETVRMLLADGRLTLEDGVARPTGDLDELSVPASLHALIASRLDGLESADRALLQAASVIGKTFTVEAVAAVAGMEPDEAATHLRGLLRREMLTLEADPRSPELGQYGFVQGLVREVAYGTLARTDRRRLHLAAARYFETLDDEGIAGALAEHYVAAYRAQPEGPEGDAVAAQARVALRGAAERARALGSFVQAKRFLERALEVTTDPVEELALQAAAGEAALYGGLGEEGLPHTARALELARQVGDDEGIVLATVAHGIAYGVSGHVAEDAALLEPVREEFRHLEATSGFVRLSGELARAYLLLQRNEDSLRVVDETLPTAERLELERETVELVVTRAACLAAMGRPAEGTMLLIGAVATASARGLQQTELRARVNLGYAAAADDPQLAYRASREGVELAKRLGLRSYFYYLIGNTAEFAIANGDWDWILAELDRAVSESDLDLAAKLRRAQILGMRGQDVEAQFAELAERVADWTEVQARVIVDEARAEVAFAQGDHVAALAFARAAYEVNTAPDTTGAHTAIRAAAALGDADPIIGAIRAIEKLPGRSGRAQRRDGEAALAAIAGRRSEALAAYVDAIRRWEELGLTFEAALTRLDLVTLLGTDSQEGQAAAAEARAVFARVGATALLERLDAAVGSARAPGATGSPAEARTASASSG